MCFFIYIYQNKIFMALTTLGLSVDLNVNDTCDSLTIEDTTGLYNAVTNPLGYNQTGGVTINSVVNVAVILNYETQGLYITYIFTVSSGTITAATLGIQGGTPVSIFTELTSTVFPFTTIPFDLGADYGVTIPEITDGVYSVNYIIAGAANDSQAVSTEYSLTTSMQIVDRCDVCICNAKQFLNIDPNCACSDGSLNLAMRTFGYIQASIQAAEYGNVTASVDALNKAIELCDCSCDC